MKITRLSELAGTMKTLDVGFLAVCEGDRMAGTVTDRDIVVRGLAGSRDVSLITARDVMSKEVHWCFEDDDIEDVAEKMRDKNVRRTRTEILNAQIAAKSRSVSIRILADSSEA